MSSRRARSLAAVLLVVLLPITAQAQFGKLISKAKALRSSVDSAKAVVDTSKTVVVAAKGAVTDAASGLPVPDSSSGGAAGAHAKGSGGTAGASGPSAAVGAGAGGAAAASGTSRAKAKNTAAGAGSTQPAQPAATTAAATTAAATTRPAITGVTALTEGTFAQFMRGASAENSYRASKPTDARGAVAAGVSASGLTRADFAVVQSKVNTYAAYVMGNKEAVLPKILPAADLTVLNAHKSDILQLVKAETPPARK